MSEMLPTQIVDPDRTDLIDRCPLLSFGTGVCDAMACQSKQKTNPPQKKSMIKKTKKTNPVSEKPIINNENGIHMAATS